jgi:hypothetical protein
MPKRNVEDTFMMGNKWVIGMNFILFSLYLFEYFKRILLYLFAYFKKILLYLFAYFKKKLSCPYAWPHTPPHCLTPILLTFFLLCYAFCALNTTNHILIKLNPKHHILKKHLTLY